MQTNSKNKKVIIIGAVCLVVIVAVLSIIFVTTKPETTAGAKTITFEVISAEGETLNTYEINTDEEFLRGALEAEGLIAGEESEYGLYVLTVDGVTADEANQEWWCFTKGGEDLNSGVDTTPIADGESFEATLMIGW